MNGSPPLRYKDGREIVYEQDKGGDDCMTCMRFRPVVASQESDEHRQDE